MVNAVWNQDDCHDHPDSHERKLFTHKSRSIAHPAVIEAACRDIFDALLFRCEHGYKGAEKDNDALRPSQGNEVDHDGDCATRIDLVIKCLRESKCACRDILNEPLKILRLVNAPKAYHASKDVNKRNSKVKKQAYANY